MKDQRLEILRKLKANTISPNEAEKQLCDLFIVSESITYSYPSKQNGLPDHVHTITIGEAQKMLGNLVDRVLVLEAIVEAYSC
jgi:hypothetical protein